MAKVSRGLLAKLKSKPSARVRLIVRVKGDLSGARRRLSSGKVRVVRTLELVNALVITCTAQDAVSLLSIGCIQSLEEDRRISTQS